MVYWTVGIPLLVIILIVLILLMEPRQERISRAVAAKSMALAVTGVKECQEWEENNSSHFTDKDRDNWYVKYLDYLLGNGYLSEEVTKPDSKTAEGWLTYGEALSFAEKVSADVAAELTVPSGKMKKPMPKEAWWEFYDLLIQQVDTAEGIQVKHIELYGTPVNVDGSESWTAYTSEGTLKFEGLALDSYIDREIEVLLKDREIIHMRSLVSDEVTYENVWLSAGEDDKHFKVFVGTIFREFPYSSSLGESGELLNHLADISLKKGKVKKILLKKETITGKVLAVQEDSIEIEGYGVVPLEKHFKVYKTYGQFKEQTKKDILVGYEMQEFVVADGKICAALTRSPFAAENIRVLIMNNGFAGIYHDEIRIMGRGNLKLIYGEKEEILEAGKELSITPGNKRLVEGRLVIQPEKPGEEIVVNSISRGQGTPSYKGNMEICKDEKGMVLLNELDIEDYLTKVVPSEMPPSYEMEALKAQAVCARTYAYKQIQANDYSQYGAHVDDSTRYQVYNNIDSSDRTDAAVNETYGELLMLNDDPVDAYYFSTSCGHTTDGTIWGADASDYPYLKGIELRDGRETKDLTSNDAFLSFIKDDSFHSYDSSFAMYRWRTTVTNRQLQEKIGGVGTITGLTMLERGVGGIGKKLKITGTDGEKIINGQSQIRNLLGNTALVFTKNDGQTLTGWDSLPSAFFAIEATDRDEENQTTTFTIYGGGYGHGVGMSQNGAQGMAKEGKQYKEILQFFYDGVEVKTVND